MKVQCEGWRRRGGAFTLGPVVWEQCKEKATVRLKVEQEDKTSILPACDACWNECRTNKIKIIEVLPIKK